MEQARSEKGSRLGPLRCPACLSVLRISTPSGEGAVGERDLGSACGRSFRVRDGVPNLVYPSRLARSDQRFLGQYEALADRYDSAVRRLFRDLGGRESEFRAWMCGLVPRSPGGSLLEVSCGTGANLPHLAQRVGGKGSIWAIDLSPAMLSLARSESARSRLAVRFALANGAYLPFADSSFDSVFHFGGINTFGDIRRALREMNRVVRPRGQVVVSDEGLAPWKVKTPEGRGLVKKNRLYLCRPPLESLPSGITDVNLRWTLKDAFYVLEFRKATRAT